MPLKNMIKIDLIIKINFGLLSHHLFILFSRVNEAPQTAPTIVNKCPVLFKLIILLHKKIFLSYISLYYIHSLIFEK